MSNQNAAIVFTFAGLGQGYCFTTPERFALDITAAMQGYLPGAYSTIIKSDSEPNANDRDKLWFKLLPGGAPTGRLYSYYLGKWVFPNPVEAAAQSRIWFEGSEAQLWSYDGGDGTDPASNPPTATTGAMWVRDTNYDFRFPLAMGTSPAPASTTVSPGDTGGSENVSLTVEQLAPHSHSLNNDGPGKFGRYNESDGNTNPWGSGNVNNFEGEFTFSTQNAGGDSDGVVVPHPNMPPWRCGIWAVRSARVYYVA